jgi:tRNA pseudouridine55 synthase
MIYTKEAFLTGQVILINKPLHWTSFQVVNKVRWLIRQKLNIKKIKVGHAGTLDPLATGLLILCSGKMTKEIDRFQGQEKEYSGRFLLGATTPSFDLETEIDQEFSTNHITKEMIENTRKKFVGSIQQKPPIFSALKKDGKRLYTFAREGESVDVPSREVSITNLTLDPSGFPLIGFVTSCSKGTYIRSLAHDFGKALKSGAHLTDLCRERIGEFRLDQAISIDEFEEQLRAAKEEIPSKTDS